MNSIKSLGVVHVIAYRLWLFNLLLTDHFLDPSANVQRHEIRSAIVTSWVRKKLGRHDQIHW